MVSFLVRIGKLGILKEVYWSDPAYLFPHLNTSFLDCFTDPEKALLVQVIARCQNENCFQCELALKLMNFPTRVNLCALPVVEDLFILGVEENSLAYSPAEREVIHHLLIAIRDSASKSEAAAHTETVRQQFEHIQRLNNELINTRRALEKTNAQLNIANQDLNNRLVRDALTGLVSRYQYRTEIENAIRKYPGQFAIFTYIDLDQFKAINDRYGHAIGDRYLVEFAERLKHLPLQNTIKIRIAGDEFGMFTAGLETADFAQVEAIWTQLTNGVMSAPVTLDDLILPLSLSAGMAVYGKDTLDIYTLIDYADFAMYRAKSAGKSQFRIFDLAEYQDTKQGSGQG